MTDYLPLRITRSAAAAPVTANPWVRLEQIVPAETNQFAALEDLYRSWMYAASGLSARMFRPAGCPVEFDGRVVRFFLGFYSWPSHPDLRYELISNIGTLGPTQIVGDIREFTLFANNVIGLPLPYYMESVTVAWESPVFDRYGSQILEPEIFNHNTHLIFSRESFGALRISGIARGGYHVLTVEVDRENEEIPTAAPERTGDDNTYYLDEQPLENANRIENLEPTVRAIWEKGATDTLVDQELTLEEEKLSIEVPLCVQEALTACPGDGSALGGGKYVSRWCESNSGWQVYYSTCDGSVLQGRKGQNPRRYCSGAAISASSLGLWLRRAL